MNKSNYLCVLTGQVHVLCELCLVHFRTWEHMPWAVVHKRRAQHEH